jgi:RNA-binding motif X-linked protein 2
MECKSLPFRNLYENCTLILLHRSPDASWHADYRDTAYIYIGGLPFELSEGDIITIFSQFGEPTFVRLIRDKETGKSKGFAFLKYEDQRSTDLAVDNLGGATIMGRMLRVDHTRYKKRDDDAEEDTDMKDPRASAGAIGDGEVRKLKGQSTESDDEAGRPILKEERELNALIRDHDDDDPMKPFLIEKKKEEIATAMAGRKDSKFSRKEHKRGHHRHRSHRARDGDDYTEDKRSSRRYRDERNYSRSRSKDRSFRTDATDDYADGSRHSRRRREDQPRSGSRSKDHYDKRDAYDDDSRTRRNHALSRDY